MRCENVPMYSLETYVEKFVKSDGPINILSNERDLSFFDPLAANHDIRFLEGSIGGKIWILWLLYDFSLFHFEFLEYLISI